ncbi:MAG: hypothetical protein R8J85_10560 [Mariprofundales bacterium]
MTSRNIWYQTEQWSDYFSANRVTWAQFYASERAIVERLLLPQGGE